MGNFFYIAAEKIRNGTIKIIDKAKQALKKFFEKALDFLKRASVKYSQKKGYDYKGQTYYIKKKDGQFRKGTDIIHLDKEMGEYYKTTVEKRVLEEEVPPQYRDIKNDEMIDNTEELDGVLQF